MLGAAVGSVAHLLLPGSTAGPGAYALVGMGAAFAGIVRTPLTSVFMIFEVTRDYTIIVPLMISNLIAFFISQRLQPEPIYEALSHQEGVHLPTAESRALPRRAQVLSAMRNPPETLTPELRLREAMERVERSALDAWPVVGTLGLQGMLHRRELAEAIARGQSEDRIDALLTRLASDLTDRQHLHPDHSLGIALERMGSSGSNVLPVVSRANVRHLLGIVTLEDLLDAFGFASTEPARAHRV